MAVVNTKSTLFHDPHGAALEPDPLLKAGRLVVATGRVANAAADSSLSMYHIIDLPSDCILHSQTWFDVEDDGFAAIRIGTRTDVDALVSQTKATENIITPIAAGDLLHDKRLWEVLGLAADPGGFIGLYKHAIAGATGDGAMPFQIAYLYH